MSTPSNLTKNRTISIKLSGIEEYLKKIQEVGGNVEESVTQAIAESAKPIYDDIKAWAEKHKLTGATLKGVSISEVQREGNKFYVDVGIDTSKSENAWHAVFVEYGSPHNAADPGIRNAFANNKSKVKKIQRDILKKAGMPDE